MRWPVSHNKSRVATASMSDQIELGREESELHFAGRGWVKSRDFELGKTCREGTCIGHNDILEVIEQ